MLVHFQSYITLKVPANSYLYGVVTQMEIRVKESFEHLRKRNPSGAWFETQNTGTCFKL